MGKKDVSYEDIFEGFSEEEKDMLLTLSTNEYFNYIYKGEKFQKILGKINLNGTLTDEEWDFVTEKLFLVSVKSETEYEVDELDFKDRIILNACRFGTKVSREDSSLYNECYKMKEFYESYRKLRILSKYLFSSYTVVDDYRDMDLLKLLIDLNLVCYEFREYRELFKSAFITHNEVERSNFGDINGAERSNLNRMNRAYDSAVVIYRKIMQ